MSELELEAKINTAINIIDDSIIKYTKKYSTRKESEEENNLIHDKLELLNKLKIEIYKGNIDVINKIINRKGII